MPVQGYLPLNGTGAREGRKQPHRVVVRAAPRAHPDPHVMHGMPGSLVGGMLRAPTLLDATCGGEPIRLVGHNLTVRRRVQRAAAATRVAHTCGP